jgi:hypothetical protein
VLAIGFHPAFLHKRVGLGEQRKTRSGCVGCALTQVNLGSEMVSLTIVVMPIGFDLEKIPV